MTARVGLIVVVLLGGYLCLRDLDQTTLWDDEAVVGVVARNLRATGRLTGWDGRNLIMVRQGRLLDENLRPLMPPLHYYVAAASFQLFGESTWSARLPFAVAGVAALICFAAMLHRLGRGDRGLVIFGAGLLAFSVTYILFVRQCRYYALSVLATVCMYWFYARFMDRRRWSDAILLAVAAIVSFYSNYFVCAMFLLALAALHLCIHRRDGRRLAWVASLFLIATVPYAIQYRIWHRPDIRSQMPWFERHATLLWLNAKALSSEGMLPWMIMPAMVAVLYIARRRHSRLVRLAAHGLLLSLFYVLLLALCSPQPSRGATLADVRYLVVVLPFLAASIGATLSIVFAWRRAPAVVIAVALVSCNVFSVNPADPRFEWWLPAMVRELHQPHPTAAGRVCDYLREHAEHDDSVLTYPFAENYPLMFYLGDRIRIAGYLHDDAPLRESARASRNFPHWLVMYGRLKKSPVYVDYFSRTHVDPDGKPRRFQYRQVARLDVYWRQTHRSPLRRHHFGPVNDFDPDLEAVYILRREPADPLYD